MARIPTASETGLGNANYQQTGTTPVLQRPVAREAGPMQQVTQRTVEKHFGTPYFTAFKPVIKDNGDRFIQQGLNDLSGTVAKVAEFKQAEIQKVNEAAEKTSLMVTIGDQKSAYQQNTLDIINHPTMPNEEKAKNLQTLEDQFKETITAAKPQYQPVVASEVMGTIGSVRAQAQDVFLRNQQDGIKGNLVKRQQQLTLDAASTGDLDTALLHFDALQGAYKSAGLTDAHFASDRQKFEQGILQNDIMGTLKSVDVKSGASALESVTNILARLTETDEQGAPKNWTKLDPVRRNADIAAVIQKKDQIESDLKSQMSDSLGRLKSDFSVGMAYYSDALKNGDPLDPKLSIRLREQAQTMIQLEPDKTAGYTGLLQLQKAEQEYGPAYRAQQSAKDPLFSTGVRPISFQDVSSPEALQAKFAENIKIGKSVKDAKGLTFVPVLRNADMDGIAKTIEENPSNGIRMVHTLKQSLGEDGASSLTYVAGQMANSKDPSAPAAAAIIYSVAKGDYNTAQTLASGMEVIRNKSITMPKDVDLRDRFNSLLGDAMSENSANRGINFEAYKTAYAAGAARKNVVDGNFDRDIANDAFQRVVGSVTKWNGSSVLLPDNMDESKFKDYISSITPETVQMWGGVHGMTNEKATDLIKDDATLRAVSPGKYTVFYNGRQALTTGGRQFIIDIHQPIVNPKPDGTRQYIESMSTGY